MRWQSSASSSWRSLVLTFLEWYWLTCENKIDLRRLLDQIRSFAAPHSVPRWKTQSSLSKLSFLSIRVAGVESWRLRDKNGNYGIIGATEDANSNFDAKLKLLYRNFNIRQYLRNFLSSVDLWEAIAKFHSFQSGLGAILQPPSNYTNAVESLLIYEWTNFGISVDQCSLVQDDAVFISSHRIFCFGW